MSAFLRCTVLAALTVTVLAAPSKVLAQPGGPQAHPPAAQPRLTKTPELIDFVEAEYPKGALADNRAATVILRLAISAKGTVDEAVVLTGAGADFDAAALDAVRKFRFRPAEIDDKPAPVKITYRYEFKPKVVAPTTGKFRGVVLSKRTGAPLSGVTIELEGAGQAVTNERGEFSFDDVPPGELAVTVSGKDLTRVQTQETVEAGRTLEARYDIELPPPADDVPEGEKDDLEIVVLAPKLVKQVVSTEVIFQRLGRGPTVPALVPADACARLGPSSAAADPGGVAPRPVDPDLSGGYQQPIVVGSELGAVLGSVRLGCGIIGVPSAEAIRFNQGYRPNENPEVARLELASPDGPQTIAAGVERAGVAVRAGTRLNLRAVWAACPRQPACGDGLCTTGENQSNCAADCRTEPRGCTGAETYLAADPETKTVVERREGIAVAWYATSGAFVEEQTGRTEGDPDGVDASNVWTAPSSSGLVQLWVVIRDDRGGVGWEQYLVQVDP